jgi:hypothetical protein
LNAPLTVRRASAFGWDAIGPWKRCWPSLTIINHH